jgi:hypothetical protein
MNLGLAALFGEFLQMPLARTYELYELWCFLRLLRAAVEEYGAGMVDTGSLFLAGDDGSVTVAAGSVIVPVGPYALCFQRQYREFWRESDGQGSFSRTMIPDIAMTAAPQTPGSRHLVVLDAKYRIDSGLNDALNSIHTYRDALVREVGSGEIEGIVRAAYLITPHVPELAMDYRSTDLPGRLFHPEYRQGFRFGAVTMRPGMTSAEIRESLRTIVADAALGGAHG